MVADGDVAFSYDRGGDTCIKEGRPALDSRPSFIHPKLRSCYHRILEQLQISLQS